MAKSNIFLVTAILIFLGCSGSHVRAQSGTTAQQGRRITCASDDGRRHFCPINTGAGVRMVNQRSGSPCVQGRTWGFQRNGIWVDRGCRADFVVAALQPGRPMPPPAMRIITCSSNDMGRHLCPADTRRGVRLIQQRSNSACIQGRTWGFDSRGIWVDRGCRADFSLGVR